MNVQIKNISKSYKGKNILNNVNFNIDSGSICGLLGINGAGKSTLMKILFNLEVADEGEILFDGNKQLARNKMGALIEFPAIYQNLSAFDNLKTKALLYGISDERINQTLSIIGLENTGNKKAGKFSLGMKQRLGIGMAILTEPEFLILDEPTNGLDPDGINELLDLMRKLKESGTTILVSSHQLHEVSKVADKIVILNQGQIRYDNLNNDDSDLEQTFFRIVHGGE